MPVSELRTPSKRSVRYFIICNRNTSLLVLLAAYTEGVQCRRVRPAQTETGAIT